MLLGVERRLDGAQLVWVRLRVRLRVRRRVRRRVRVRALTLRVLTLRVLTLTLRVGYLSLTLRVGYLVVEVDALLLEPLDDLVVSLADALRLVVLDHRLG